MGDSKKKDNGKNSLEFYIEIVNTHPALSKEELIRLGKILLGECDGHKETAIEKLLNSHQRFVIDIALKQQKLHYYCPVDIMDLIAAGNDGLYAAIMRWDYKKGALTTYAQPWVRSAIIKEFPLTPDEEQREKILKELQTEKGKQSHIDQWKKVDFKRNAENCYATIDETLIRQKSSLPVKELSEENKKLFDLLQSLTFQDKTTQAILHVMLNHYRYQNVSNEEMAKDMMRKFSLSRKELDYHLDQIKEGINSAEKDARISEADKTDLSAFTKLLASITSGETYILEAKQADYASLFNHSEGLDKTEALSNPTLWKFHKPPFSSLNRKEFFKTAETIQSIPCYKYVIRYLLQTLDITIGKENEERLFALKGSWGLAIQSTDLPYEKISAVQITETDCNKLMKHLCMKVLDDFTYANINIPQGAWTTHFKNNMVNDLKSSQLNELALVYHMDLDVYLAFRSKVLKIISRDFLDREFLFTFMVLKYADSCGLNDWVSAYRKLEELYASTGTIIDTRISEFTSTISLSTDFFLTLETNGKLKPDYHSKLFTEKIDELQEIFDATDILASNRIRRTFEKECEEQRKKLEANITVNYYDEIVQMIQKEKKTKTKDYQIDFAKVLSFLYGSGTSKLKVKDFKKFRKTLKGDSYLLSEEFDQTMITDSRISQFGILGNSERRNILLTLLFLNYAFDLQKPENSILSYEERISDFKYRVGASLGKCNFMILHNSNAYDTFLMLMLTCKNPLELFRFIWHQKTTVLMKEAMPNELTK